MCEKCPTDHPPGSLPESAVAALHRSVEEGRGAHSIEMPSGSGLEGRRILLKGGHILSMDPDVGDFVRGDVLVEGSTIVAIGPDVEATGASIVDVSGQIVMPGFVDTHHHQFETALRAYLADGIMLADPKRPNAPNYMEHVLGRLAPVYRPEDVYISELVGSISQLDAGVTTVLDVSQIHHSPEHTDAAVSALRDARRRAVLGYFEGQGAQCSYPEDASRVRQQFFNTNDGLVTMAMGGEVYLPGWEKAWQKGRELDLQIVFHAVGSVGLREGVDSVARSGWLRDDNLLIHMTGMTDATWKAVAEVGAHLSLSVPIEMSMRHGMPPILKAQQMGIVPSLSTDVECTMTADFFTQMRSVMTLQRALVNEATLNGEETSTLLSPKQVLHFATMGGAKALRMAHKIGSLSPGKQADILLLDAKALNVAPLNNVPGAVVTLMERSNVEGVMVAGKIVKWGGKLVDVDWMGLRGRLEASRDHLFAAAGIEIDLFA